MKARAPFVMVGEAARVGPPLSGRSGGRIEQLMGSPLRDVFEPVNLLRRWPGKAAGGRGDAWPTAAARESAVRWLRRRRRRRDVRPVVLLGDRVAAAFGLRGATVLRWTAAGLGDRLGMTVVAVVPHPSGINRWWNDARNARAAREFLIGAARSAAGRDARRRCKLCGEPERRSEVGGFRFTTVAPGLGVCVDCVNAGRL